MKRKNQLKKLRALLKNKIDEYTRKIEKFSFTGTQDVFILESKRDLYISRYKEVTDDLTNFSRFY